MAFIVLQIVGQFALIAQSCIVDKRNSRNPIAVFQLTIALNIVLSASEIPHEVTPIHEVALIGKEETNVLHLCRNLHRHGFSATIIRNIRAVDTAHPVFIGLCMRLIVHTWEEHVLCIAVLVLVAHHEIGVFFPGVRLLFASVDGCAFAHFGLAHVAINL